MRTLFGPENDGLHIHPATPGAYEWWYFDALSDDGRYALVVIFFLGTPMSPYYKDVVDGRNPLPMDWCGVFVTLHEKIRGRWRECAYAYNLYRNGDFDDAPSRARIGGSELTTTITGEGDDQRYTWHLSLDEPGLWFGRTKGRITFTSPGPPLTHEPLGDDNDPHTWVCVAPICRTDAEIILSNGKRVTFTAHGYHDHNYGQLPWDDIHAWYWGRSRAVCTDGKTRAGILYGTVKLDRSAQAILLFVEEPGRLTTVVSTECFSRYMLHGNGYGVEQAIGVTAYTLAPSPGEFSGFEAIIAMDWDREPHYLSNGPFYFRAVVNFTMGPGMKQEASAPGTAWKGKGMGIGEVFQPARLCDPLWSRLMWTRIRRRG